MPKLLMTIFTENSSLGASMLCNLAREKFGWDVDIFFVPRDADASGLEKHITNYQPDLVGFTFKSFERNQALRVAAETRKSFPELPLIAGGIHPTLQPQDVLEEKTFNAVIVGDGMGILGDILEKYKSYDETIVYGQANPDKTAYCRFFHSEAQIERMRKTQTATILTSIGCPFSCTFCHSGSEGFQVLPIEAVADYVIFLYKEHGVRCFHFVDDLFAGNHKRLQKFRTIIQETLPEFTISSQVSGKPSTFTPKIAEELVKLGVETMNFGVETTSPKMLKFLNKKQSVQDCYDAIKICHDFGLNAVANIMFGIPTQTEEDYEHTLEYVKNAQPDSITTFFYSAYPGTVLYDYCFENGYLPDTFNRNKFDWFKPEVDGISDIQMQFNKVDYDLARKYVEKTKNILNRDEYLFNRLEQVDELPWVFVGTTRHFYFKTMLKKLSARQWRNCLGYINLDEETGFHLDGDVTLPRYNVGASSMPELGATYSFLGSDYKVIKGMFSKRLKKPLPLISVSNFRKSHTVEDIRSIKGDLTHH